MNNELLNFEKFLKQINDKLDRSYQNVDELEDFDIEEEIKKSSKNHHFIPQYYIKGFTDEDNLLFVYDKQRDEIKNVRKGSAGVFFQRHRNSMKVNDSFVSIFEDGYSIIESNVSHAIKLLRSNISNVSEDVKIGLMATLNIFVIDIFWRNINTDDFFDKLYEKSKVEVFGLNEEEKHIFSSKIKDVEGYKQLIRGSFLDSYMEMFLNSDPNIKNSCELIDFPLEQICIGDNPLLFKEFPEKPIDLFYTPLIIPISKSKFYKRNIERKKSYNIIDTNIFNALIIDQSSQIICASSLKTLEDAIKIYKYLKENNLIKQFKNTLFE